MEYIFVPKYLRKIKISNLYLLRKNSINYCIYFKHINFNWFGEGQETFTYTQTIPSITSLEI